MRALPGTSQICHYARAHVLGCADGDVSQPNSRCSHGDSDSFDVGWKFSTHPCISLHAYELRRCRHVLGICRYLCRRLRCHESPLAGNEEQDTRTIRTRAVGIDSTKPTSNTDATHRTYITVSKCPKQSDRIHDGVVAQIDGMAMYVGTLGIRGAQRLSFSRKPQVRRLFRDDECGPRAQNDTPTND